MYSRRVNPLTVVDIGQSIRPGGADLYQKAEIFPLLGLRSHPRAPIGVKFRNTNQNYVLLGRANFHVNRWNDSPLRVENAEFWPVNKNSTSSCRFAAILPVRSNIQTSCFRTNYSWRALFLSSPKLCNVETIKNVSTFFLSNSVFPTVFPNFPKFPGKWLTHGFLAITM